MPDPLLPRPAPTGLQRLAAQPLPVVGQALLVAVTQDPWPVPLPCPLTPWLVHRLVRPAARDDYLAYALRHIAWRLAS